MSLKKLQTAKIDVYQMLDDIINIEGDILEKKIKKKNGKIESVILTLSKNYNDVSVKGILRPYYYIWDSIKKILTIKKEK